MSRALWLLALVLQLLAGPSHAIGTTNGTATTVPRYCTGGSGNCPNTASTTAQGSGELQCSALNNSGQTPPYIGWVWNVNPTSGHCTTAGGANSGVYAVAVNGTMAGPTTCPANATNVNGGCMCNNGYRPPTGSNPTTCVAYTCPTQVLGGVNVVTSNSAAANWAGTSGYYCDSTTDTTNSRPYFGCAVRFDVTESSAFPLGGGTSYALRGVGSYVAGKTCQASSEAFKPDTVPPTQLPASAASTGTTTGLPAPANACDSGTCPGTVNGQSVCVACSTTTKADSVSSTATPSGSASAPSGTTAGTTVTTSSCTNGFCTKSVTVTDPNGVVLGTVTSAPIAQSDFCKGNPTSSQCNGSGAAGSPDGGASGPDSSFGGSCSASFSCSGDAIQCAMAQEQYRRNCSLFDNVTPEVTAGLAAINKSPTLVRDGVADTEVNVGALFTVLPGNPYGGSCPGDQTVAGFTIPLSNVCGSLQLLGTLLIAFTVVSCAAWLVTKGA